MNKSMTLGYIGLGKMGMSMVARLIEKGNVIIATDAESNSLEKAARMGVDVYASAREVAKHLKSPRVIWIMVPHRVVDTILDEMVPELSAGDIVIDGGNSLYTESMRRYEALKKQGIEFLDVGVSGGPNGALTGACVMIGGERHVYEKVEQLFADISATDSYQYVGTSGAGHFVKMVHNGIEYGMMQAIGEGFDVLKQSSFNLNLTDIAQLYNTKSVCESRLMGWLCDAFSQYGEELSDISGVVDHSGEGQWTVDTAHQLNVPVPVIEEALAYRKNSIKNPRYTGQVVSALRNQFGGHKVTKENK